MQTGFGFLILFGLSCMLFPCEGRIISPAKGTEFTFLPGTTRNITWIFDDAISSLLLRGWYFTRRGGSTSERLATIADNDDPKIRKSSLSGVEIVKPGTLLLKNVNQSHNGMYQFELTASGPGISSDVTVFIAEKPIVKINCSRPMPIKLNEGDNFTCVCRGEGGNPPADVTWYKNGTQFGETRKENNTLTRTNVDESDNVTYTCLAQSYPDSMYEDSESVVVQVKFKPKGTTIEFTQNPAKLNTSVDIKCKSRGFPEPSYTITLNGTKTVSTDKTHTISMVWWNDTGTYNCTATNERGSDWAAKFLDVTEQGPTTTSAATTTASTTASSTPKKSSESTKTSTTKGNNGSEPAPTPTSTSASTSASTSSPPDLSTGAIIGIIIGVLVLIIIVGVVVYCCKSKEKERSNSCANIDPVPGNSHELGETGPGDGAYDTVWPVETSESKSNPPVENALPPVYAAVDKNNREGNTLYASLDNEALQSSRASKKEPNRPPETDYASIDFAKTGNAPKAV